jgi:hypothetical protein
MDDTGRGNCKSLIFNTKEKKMKTSSQRGTLVIFLIAGLVALNGSKSFNLHAASQDCTAAILQGGYGAGTTGLINSSSNPNDVTIPTFVPFAEAVHFVFDGHGRFFGTSTADYGGTIFPVTFTGTYSVKQNCTGSLTADAGDNGIIHRALVIVDGGKEVEFVSTDAGVVIAGYMKKQRSE